MTVPFDKPGVYTGGNLRGNWLIDELLRGGLGDPDFVLFGGDMVHGAKLESLDAELPAFKSLAARLSCKTFPSVGNHENMSAEADPVYEGIYWNTYGRDRAQYTFEHKGILFVVLNNSGDPPHGARKEIQEDIRRQRLRFLEGVLSSRPGIPKIIVCHIPLVPVREAKVLEKSFGFASWMAHDDLLVQMLEKHRDSVLAVLSGHLHLTGVVSKNGIAHIVPSGLASFPHDIAVFDVFTDYIDVRMVSAPKELAKPDESDIHGMRRHKVDYIDSDHPTHELYCRGNDSERRFEIPLASGVTNTFTY